jgi:hypothetical protein
MMTTRPVPCAWSPSEPRGRLLAATLLHGLGQWLARAAQRLAGRDRLVREPVLEFYAEAGAPEGALYVDGELVGHLDVTRL